MRYSVEPKDQIYVKGYVFLLFAKIMGSKHEKKLLNTTKKVDNQFLKEGNRKKGSNR